MSFVLSPSEGTVGFQSAARALRLKVWGDVAVVFMGCVSVGHSR